MACTIESALGYEFLRRIPQLRADLDGAWEIAERGPVRLYLADSHLQGAQFFRDKGELKAAREVIKRRGYWRRKEALEEAEAAAKGWLEGM